MKKEQVNPLQQVDEAFDPWEQGRPIPLFLTAVVFALAIWGTLTYFTEHASQKRAAEERPARKANAGATAGASNLSNADAATLRLVESGKGAAWSCASCHGAAGEGGLTTPRLAGQPAAYLAKQLEDFAAGRRANEHMAMVARALAPDEIQKLARYYAQIGLASTVTPGLGGNLARGRVLALHGDWKNNVPACVSCHGLSGEGVAPSFPALAGQHPEYLFAQLAGWHAGGRGNSPQSLMEGVARRMTVDDMRDVADYFASLPVRPAPGSTSGAGSAPASGAAAPAASTAGPGGADAFHS